DDDEHSEKREREQHRGQSTPSRWTPQYGTSCAGRMTSDERQELLALVRATRAELDSWRATALDVIPLAETVATDQPPGSTAATPTPPGPSVSATPPSL